MRRHLMFIFLFVFDKDICYFPSSEDGNTIQDSDVSFFHCLGIKFITTFMVSVGTDYSCHILCRSGSGHKLPPGIYYYYY